jgi:hypothetical protein
MGKLKTSWTGRRLTWRITREDWRGRRRTIRILRATSLEKKGN